MRSARLAVAAIVALSLSGPALSAPKPAESWGRAGVDFETYRQDAEECGRMAYYADVSETEHAKVFVLGTRRLQSLDGLAAKQLDQANAVVDASDVAARYGQTHDSVRPERRIRELRDALQSIVDICLAHRGYVKFRLTEDQRDELGHLRKGSDERHHYLHMLASDATVLEKQAVEKAQA